MKKIGMIVAISKEFQSALNKFGTENEIIEDSGYKTFIYQRDNYTLYMLSSGAGEIFASSATQYLITKFGVDIIVNFGIVGGLTHQMSNKKLCIVENVVHYDFDTSKVDNVEVGRYLDYPTIYIPTSKELLDIALSIEPSLTTTICASGDKFIADSDKKSELHTKYHADICDMESAGIVLTCNRCNTPCLLIKAVADTLFGGTEEYNVSATTVAIECVKMIDKIISKI